MTDDSTGSEVQVEQRDDRGDLDGNEVREHEEERVGEGDEDATYDEVHVKYYTGCLYDIHMAYKYQSIGRRSM